MNVTTETTKRFTVSDLTEDQAQDLLVLAVNLPVDQVQQGVITSAQRETLSNLRQALLSAGVEMGKKERRSAERTETPADRKLEESIGAGYGA